LRPLDIFGSLRIKLGVLVAGAVTCATVIMWIGTANNYGPTYTLPLAVCGAMVVTQALAHGMTAPLREMIQAARSMARGDYSVRVRATSRDEVGELAHTFNRMAEDLAKADLRRRDMIANVSHELRTPVAALQAELENMADGVTAPTPETLGLALAQTERLSRLVIDMLDISRLEAGAIQLHLTKVRLDEFFEEALDAVAFVASNSGKGLIFLTETSSADLTITADLDRLHQVTANLLSNAIRHSPEGGTVTLRGYSRGSRRVVIEVEDEGPGIPPEARQEVFERFRRGVAASGSLVRGGAGTGLGLTIARWAVDLHKGTIEIADTKKGCLMQVILPARGPSLPKEKEGKRSSPTATPKTKAERRHRAPWWRKKSQESGEAT